MRLETDSGDRIELGALLGEGGQGRVYRVNNDRSRAVKLYKTPNKQLEDKIRDFVTLPENRRPSSCSAAWPLTPVYQTTGLWWWKKAEFMGYTMPYIPNVKPIFCYYTPKERKKHDLHFNWHDMHCLAFNLANVFKQFHDHGLVIGDVNCKNILVNSNLAPIIIDVDSIQISSKYTTDVGFAEYTPPELAGKSLKNVVRTKYHDLFGLGYLIFQLLMNGCSPFAGVPNKELSWEYVDKHCKERGIFPFYKNPYVIPPPGLPDSNIFHPELTAGFIWCFIMGRRNPAKRPDAETWRRTLKRALMSLIPCDWNDDHVYSSHLSNCPWCK